MCVIQIHIAAKVRLSKHVLEIPVVKISKHIYSLTCDHTLIYPGHIYTLYCIFAYFNLYIVRLGITIIVFFCIRR